MKMLKKNKKIRCFYCPKEHTKKRFLGKQKIDLRLDKQTKKQCQRQPF